MKLNKIIVLILVFSMLFVQSTIIMAFEPQEDNIDDEENTSEKDVLPNSIVDPNPGEILAQIKPTSGLYDDGGRIYQADNFATHYFFDMEENFGNNTIGSCGYVATAMLLSYYDTYWDDGIIDENYDSEGSLDTLDLLNYFNISPGIRRENDSLLGGEEDEDLMIRNLDSTGYWQLVQNNYMDYFQLYLIKLAEEEFDMYHDIFVELEENDIVDQTGYPCASTLSQQIDLIKYYLYQERGYTKDEVEVKHVTSNMREFTINRIKEGQPVILFLGSPSGFHFVIAYDLNDNGTEDISDDEIYAHYGWGEDKTHINIDTDDYPWLVSAMALNFTIEHSCSNNYEYNDDYYCSCYFSCHPNHEHAYEYYDENQHIYSCNCVVKDENKVEHNWQYTSNIIGGHTKTCSDCGYSKSESHVYEYSYENADTHKGTCSLCGYESIEDHYYNCTYVDSDSHLGVCRECGHEATLSHSYEYKAIDSTYHILTCKCGATSGTSSKHLWTAALEDNVVKCKTCARTKILAPGEMIPIIKTKPIIIEEESE